MLAPGAIVDNKFRILAAIGMGAYGAVYKAEQISMERTVALKMLQHEGLPSKVDAKRFEQEAHLLSLVRHRNLVLFYGYGMHRGCPYIAMEFVEGTPLQSRLTDATELSVAETVAFSKQILSALSSIHAHGFFHRDLKPGNVLLTGDTEPGGGPTIKMIDFGLAKIMKAAGVTTQKLTETGFAVGTVEYMAPEQCVGQVCDGRADIYSLGCVMYRCLTGREPFRSEDPFGVLQQHLHDKAPDLAQIRPDLAFPDGLQSIIDTALAKDPAERFQSAQGMLEALETMESGGKLNLAAVRHKQAIATKRMAPLQVVCLALVVTLMIFAGVWTFNHRKINSGEQTNSVALFDKFDRHLAFITAVPSGFTISFDQAFANAKFNKECDRQCIDTLKANDRDHLLKDDQLTLLYGYLADIKGVQGDWSECRKYAKLALPRMLRARWLDRNLEDCVGWYVKAAVHFGDLADAETTQLEVIKAWRQYSPERPPLGLAVTYSHYLTDRGRYQEAIDVATPYLKSREDDAEYVRGAIAAAQKGMSASRH